MRARRTFTIDHETLALLQRVGNYSDYANKLILHQARMWTEGLALLCERGWRSEEILAACDALAGYSQSIASAGGTFVSDELERKEQLHRDFALRQVSSPRRSKCFEQVRADPIVAVALMAVVREYWLENEDCRQAIRNVARRA